MTKFFTKKARVKSLQLLDCRELDDELDADAKSFDNTMIENLQ